MNGNVNSLHIGEYNMTQDITALPEGLEIDYDIIPLWQKVKKERGQKS